MDPVVVLLRIRLMGPADADYQSFMDDRRATGGGFLEKRAVQKFYKELGVKNDSFVKRCSDARAAFIQTGFIETQHLRGGSALR